MTVAEKTPRTAATPAKKAAPRKSVAKRAAAPSDDKVVVFLIGPSYGAEHNARRTVDKATAERLVRNGVARYPASK